jgi:hypothetical protein
MRWLECRAKTGPVFTMKYGAFFAPCSADRGMLEFTPVAFDKTRAYGGIASTISTVFF